MAASSSSLAAEPSPSPTQILFARAVIYSFDLWPALRLAVSEQWGGIESKAKADFLISYLCDEYSEEKRQEGAAAATSTRPPVTLIGPATPDVDDLAEILEAYFCDEYESRLEDDSADWIAARIVQLHKTIYAEYPPTETSLAKANEEVNKLEQASIALRGKKVTAQKTESDEELEGEEGEHEGSGGETDEDDAMDVDASATAPSHPTRAEPLVDEDGFTTVVKGRRR